MPRYSSRTTWWVKAETSLSKGGHCLLLVHAPPERSKAASLRSVRRVLDLTMSQTEFCTCRDFYTYNIDSRIWYSEVVRNPLEEGEMGLRQPWCFEVLPTFLKKRKSLPYGGSCRRYAFRHTRCGHVFSRSARPR